MLHRTLLPVLLFAFAHICLGQTTARTGVVAERIQLANASGGDIPTTVLFDRVPASLATDRLWADACADATVLDLDLDRTSAIRNTAPPRLRLSVPGPEGTLLLDLEVRDITAGAFQVNTASRGTVPYTQGLHYRGIVQGDGASLAAISIFEDHIMGLIAHNGHQLVLGPFDEASGNLHVLYNDQDLLATPLTSCAGDLEPPFDDSMEVLPEEEDGDRSIRCVSWYWEAAHAIYLNKGSVANATDYLTGLFNQTALLFENEGIDVVLSEIFVWDEPSPYDAGSSSGRLTQFGDERTSFNGDMAHLLDFGGMGGVAWLNTLCSSQPRYRMAYSGINSSYQNVPTYSWSVSVVAHEQGHNLGSNHTHACVWNGNGTAIDGCGPAAGYSEGSCDPAPVPPSSVGGTIMSYCHLVSAGINFANGFGPQPAALMQSRVNAAQCLPACGTTCDAPPNISVSGITTTTATIAWTNAGADSYDLRWKASSSGTWTEVNGIIGTSHQLTDLTEGTSYDHQVRSNCDGTLSDYSTQTSFTTAVPCPDALEPNDTQATAAAITLPADIQALIANSTDQDFYTFTLTEQSDVSLYLYQLPADYDLRLLDENGVQQALSQNGGTWSESIWMNGLSAGSYTAQVYGWNGAFDEDMCYQLQVQAYPSQGCDAPEVVTVSEITASSATVSWSTTPAAYAYELRWRPTGTQIWNVEAPYNMPPAALSGLDSDTEHEVQVRSLCEGGQQGGTAPWSASTLFTTLPGSVGVVVQAWLEGPYDADAGLMRDDLRTLGHLPLQEPYSAQGWPVSGPAMTTPAVLAVEGAQAIVDWVMLELRDATDPVVVLQTRVGLLRRDGDVRAMDGQSPVQFDQPAGGYHLSIRHRNHLGCMTAVPQSFSPLGSFLDLRVAGNPTWGTDARKAVGGAMVLRTGNVVPDAAIKYSGTSNDRDAVLTTIGGLAPTATVIGYHAADNNLDGTVKYVGSNNDRDLILENIGGAIPTNTRVEQVP